MAFSHSSLFFFSSFLICSSAFSTGDIELSPSSAQIKFWYENVQNKMPNQIIKKLSPLSKENCDLFRGLISKNDNFAADSNFCSLANLACTSELNFSKANYGVNTYGKTHYHTAAEHGVITNDNQFSFFRLSILKVGNLVHLPHLEIPIPDRAFLPIQIASQVSLSSANEITKIFSDSAFGATKKQIETTISHCNMADQNTTEEMHSCPKSLEEMISFSKFTFGGKKLLSLSSKSTKGSNKELMVKKVIKHNADKIVACHELFLPFATYYCHSLSSTNLYTVELVEPKTGALVNTVLAICHMDTSTWSANHLSFQILKFMPGQGEVCHWFDQLDLAWIGYEDGKSVA